MGPIGVVGSSMMGGRFGAYRIHVYFSGVIPPGVPESAPLKRPQKPTGAPEKRPPGLSKP